MLGILSITTTWYKCGKTATQSSYYKHGDARSQNLTELFSDQNESLRSSFCLAIYLEAHTTASCPCLVVVC